MSRTALHVISALFLLLLITLYAPEGLTQDSTPAQAASEMKNPVKATRESLAQARKLYAVDCAMCHGSNGDGKTDMAKDMQMSLSDWTDAKALATKTDGELFNIIRGGKGKMPAEEEGRAKNVEVWNLILYIRSMAKDQPPTAANPAS